MIPIQNIYYMLSYAFQILNEQGYKNIATEQFNNTAELMAAILEKGIAIQLKRGLGKEYISQTEALSSLRGNQRNCTGNGEGCTVCKGWTSTGDSQIRICN